MAPAKRAGYKRERFLKYNKKVPPPLVLIGHAASFTPY